MNTLVATTAGPLAVETSEGDPIYHGILSDEGREIARVHTGDDLEQSKRLAQLLASAPDLLNALADVHRAYRDIHFSPSRPDRIDAMMTAEVLLRQLVTVQVVR